MTKILKDDVLHQKVHEIWNHNAAWWDHTVGEGNTFQTDLIGPATEDLLSIKPGESILDIACGSGIFSRRMACLGADVVAFDFSENFLACAVKRTTEYADKIEYIHMDATDEEQLLTLGKQRFDAAVCAMALMDMTTIDPLLSALRQLLKGDGRFVFSVLHPCFNSPGCRLMVEEKYDGEYNIGTR
jgi:2-polyprenyl-3-methyl-5-hydroxy-6-metoxy-1,4-benzoquinol methylase